MGVKLKPDADQIERFLSDLKAFSWVRDGERKWWPRFLFHYTDMRNAVEILHANCLYSRAEAERLGKLVISSGSPQILDKTSEKYKNCVRLYFRPNTPTQWWAEGIRSKTTLASEPEQYRNAHCPVPVFFLFDSSSILTRADCRFSDGNLASSSSREYSTADELRSLPWQNIYHNTPHIKGESAITTARCAEVIVPEKIDLATLRLIVCRSPAEKETLLAELSDACREYHTKRITAPHSAGFFFRRHTFVKTVRMDSDEIVFDFSTETESKGPFHLVVEFDAEGRKGQYERNPWYVNAEPNCKLRVQFAKRMPEYRVRLTLDGLLAYANTYSWFSGLF